MEYSNSNMSKIMLLLFISFLLFQAFASPLRNIAITVESADMDELTDDYWIHMIVKLKNNGDVDQSLKDIGFTYSIVENEPEKIVVNNSSVYWFNVHSKDYTYSTGSKEDVDLKLKIISENKVDLVASFSDNILHAHGGEAVVQFGLHKNDWSRFNELDDPSYVRSTTMVPNSQITVIARPGPGERATELNDYQIHFDIDNDVLVEDLSGADHSTNNKIVRELVGVNADGSDVVTRSLLFEEYKGAIWEAIEQYTTILPEMNPRIVNTPPSTSNGLRLHIWDKGDHHGWYPGYGNNVYFCTNFDYDPVTQPDGFCQTDKTTFIDRDKTYDLHHNGVSDGNIMPWVHINKTKLEHKKVAAKHGLKGYDINYLGRHEIGHAIGLFHTSPVVGWEKADESESYMFQGLNRAYNDKIFRSNDIAQLKSKDVAGVERYLLSYPYISKWITMRNDPRVNKIPEINNYHITNSFYDARYRMYETKYNGYKTTSGEDMVPHESRYYLTNYDSVYVSDYADGLNKPLGLVIDYNGYAGEKGAIYIGTENRIMKVDVNGNVSIFAGTGESGYQDGPRLSSKFTRHVNPLAIDEDGNIYITENVASRVRKISKNGIVSLVAGSPTGVSGSADGQGSNALFDGCGSLVYDNLTNSLYVTDVGNNKVRKIDQNGIVTTFAGTGAEGYLDGPVQSAQFTWPTGIAIDEANRILYVNDNGVNANYIRKINLNTGVVSTVAGQAAAGFTDGEGVGAQFDGISDIDVDEQGNIYVASGGNNAIRRVTPEGKVTTIVGKNGDGNLNGTGSIAQFSGVVDITCDNKGNIFVSDLLAGNIRKITKVMPITTNAPALGDRLDESGTNYFSFTIEEAMNYTINITPGLILTNFKFELFGPDDNYTLVQQRDNISSLNATYNLSPGKYTIRLSTTGSNNGAYLISVKNQKDLLDENIMNGNISHNGDNDWYEFDVTMNGTYYFNAVGISSSLNNKVYLYLYGEETSWNPGSLPYQQIPDRLIEEGLNGISSTLTPGHYWVRVRAGDDNLPDLNFKGTYSITTR